MIYAPRQVISIRWKDMILAIIGLVFKSNHGKDVRHFEQEFAKNVDVPHAVSFISERVGTFFVLKLLKEINNWDEPEIICPAYTFFSIPWAAKMAGYKIRFADVKREDLTIDPESIKSQINDKTKAVIVTHINGAPAALPEITAICKEYGLRLLEDCAHAALLTAFGRHLGSYDIGCFSFGDGKDLGTFGGSMITTSDDVLADRLREDILGFKEQGIIQIAKKIFGSLFLKILTTRLMYSVILYPILRWSRYFRVDNRRRDYINFMKSTKESDLTYKFSDIQSIIGLRQLKLVKANNEARRRNSKIIRGNLSKDTLSLMIPWDTLSPHTMLHDTIILDKGSDIVEAALLMGIDIRLDYCGNYKNFSGMEDYPGEDNVAATIDGHVYFIPNHPKIDPSNAKRIAQELDKVCVQYA